MRKTLSSEAIATFRNDGFHFPLRIFDASEANSLYHSYIKFQKSAIKTFGREHRFKGHLLANWLNGVVSNSYILDIVEDLIGPNILCWSSAFFAKPPKTKTYVGYHQDAAISGLQPHDNIIHIWLALKPATIENGCLRVLPRSHLDTILRLSPSNDDSNMLLEGSNAQPNASDDQYVNIVLEAGEISLHHHRMVHGSGPNQSSGDRLGLSLTYMTPSTRNVRGKDSAMLVRGNDEYGNFELEPAPDTYFSDKAITAFQRAISSPGGG